MLGAGALNRMAVLPADDPAQDSHAFIVGTARGESGCTLRLELLVGFDVEPLKSDNENRGQDNRNRGQPFGKLLQR